MSEYSMNHLYDWIFHYNPYEELWYATPKVDYMNFFGKSDKTTSLKSTEIDTLILLIYRGNENLSN